MLSIKIIFYLTNFSIIVFAIDKVELEEPELPDPWIPDDEDEENSSEINQRTGFGLSHDKEDVHFRLYYSALHPKRYDQIFVNQDKTITQARFKAGQPITFIVHGFMSSHHAPNSTVSTIKNALLRMGVINIITVDWSKLSSSASPVAFFSYIEVTQNVPVVGRRIADMIQFLIELDIASSPVAFHLIGHSLGAHVMGVAGYEIMNRTGIPIDRISGLDPAGPLYQFINKKDKLDPSDAMFVDVLHTDIGMYGSSEILGTADFYANGGKGYAQASCLNFTLLNPGDFIDGVSGVCSHSRAYRLYARSILRIKPELYGCRCRVPLPEILPSSCTRTELAVCPDRVLYGYYVPRMAKGTYYVDTEGATEIPFFNLPSSIIP